MQLVNVETCYDLLASAKNSHHMYHALQLMPARVLSLNFEDENFADDNQLATKIMKNCIPHKVYIYSIPMCIY